MKSNESISMTDPSLLFRDLDEPEAFSRIDESDDTIFYSTDHQCPYLVGGWDAMSRQGNLGFSHRLVYEPQRHVFYSVAVPNLSIMKDGIVEES